ncbi:MAG: transcriptional repressor [Fibrobacterota bacterium]|nr:transcriptional repressor [Fibrobacterota bacterium]
MKQATIKEQGKPRSTQPGQRHTQQREIIFDLIKASNGPLTIPQIHDKALKNLKLKKATRDKTIGIATVYRTINLLQENDLIHSVILPSGETRYESSHLDKHHHHFQCVKCDHVYDLGICPVGIPNGTTIPGGFQVQSHELTLYGLCPSCQNSKKLK